MTTPRYDFYETEDSLTLSIYEKISDPSQLSIAFDLRKFSYTNTEISSLVLEPLKGQIDPAASKYTVGKVKVEIKFAKAAHGRWGALVADSPDPLATSTIATTFTPSPEPEGVRKPTKNWDGITTTILGSEAERTIEQDPNVGGDSTLNSFFQKLFKDADPDTQKAMMKSYQESGGTTLSTNWDDVKQAPVEVKPPSGSEWKKWG